MTKKRKKMDENPHNYVCTLFLTDDYDKTNREGRHLGKEKGVFEWIGTVVTSRSAGITQAIHRANEHYQIFSNGAAELGATAGCVYYLNIKADKGQIKLLRAIVD